MVPRLLSTQIPVDCGFNSAIFNSMVAILNYVPLHFYYFLAFKWILRFRMMPYVKIWTFKKMTLTMTHCQGQGHHLKVQTAPESNTNSF